MERGKYKIKFDVVTERSFYFVVRQIIKEMIYITIGVVLFMLFCNFCVAEYFNVARINFLMSFGAISIPYLLYSIILKN